MTDKPVTTIINTHSHFDHVSGNVEFPATVDIVTHQNTAADIKAFRPVTSLTTPMAMSLREALGAACRSERSATRRL